MSPRVGRTAPKPAPAKKPAARKPAAKKPPAKTPTTSRKRAPAKKAAPAPAPPPPKPELTAVAGVQQDLDAIAAIGPAGETLATSGLAATAMQLARELDDRENTGASKASCARALADTLSDLRALAPKAEEGDGVDDLTKRRADRLAARGATA